MTISYQRDVASSTAGGFTRLLFKWKGSLYKLIYRELFLFMSAYVLLSLIYRQLLTPNQRSLFETVVKYFDAFLNLIPLSFVLGFYVSYVASRWWQQFLAIPWPDKMFHSIALFVDGFDDDARILRRNLLRYMNLALILVLRSISSAVKQRFPTLEHVVEAGFMTNQEKELFQAVPCNEFNTYWIPCTWFIYRLQEASKKGKLINTYALETIMREFCEFRAKCGLLWCYDWVSIPMVYTQVVTLATYVFFIFTVIGRQKIDTMKKGEFMRSGRLPMDIDLYIPIFTILQFFFYMGLLKVAEQLINPFGDDDEDFELNWLVDRHMKASFLGCDILMDPDRIPPMVKDYYWDKQNCPIPYTEASMHFKRKTYKGSADDMIIPESKQHMVLPEIEEEDEDENLRRHSKLSLTSLLLDSTHLVTGAMHSGLDYSNQTAKERRSLTDGHFPVEDGSQSRSQYTPGSWRNGGNNNPAAGTRGLSSSDATLTVNWNSTESVSDDEEDSDRRGSVTGGSGASQGTPGGMGPRRGSRLTELLDKRKKPEKKRKRDKQGFYWRRMIHDVEDLPRPRTPHLATNASLQAPEVTLQGCTPSPTPNRPTWPSLQQQDVELSSYPPVIPSRTRTSNDSTASLTRGNSGRVRLGETMRQDTGGTGGQPSIEEDTASVASFKTCPSETNLSISGLVPRQVSDNYETRILGPAGGAVKAGGNVKDPNRICVRTNSYAADPRPAGGTLPQVSEAPEDSQKTLKKQSLSKPSGTSPGRRPVSRSPSGRPQQTTSDKTGNPPHIRWKQTQ